MQQPDFSCDVEIAPRVGDSAQLVILIAENTSFDCRKALVSS